jgi:hypothetical protein
MPGMTLLDYFACRAMQSLIPETLNDRGVRDAKAFDRIADSSYAMANAMLKVRARVG